MKVTTNDLLAALEQYGFEQPKRPTGKGWVQLKDLATQKHTTPGAIKAQMMLARKNGVAIERFTGSDYNEKGRLCKQTWFRVKP